MGIYKTPLRYPGGKQKIWKFIKELLVANKMIGGHYVEPFAGGAGVAIELLLDGSVSAIHLNDYDAAVYAFWKTLIFDAERFCRKILVASLTIDEWRHQKKIYSERQCSEFELGYAFFFLNRCNRSGILTGGVIGGQSQLGEWKIDARFNRNDLISRIEAIAKHKDKINISHMDAKEYIANYVHALPTRSTLIYFDPPYFNKAERLYANHYNEEHHVDLARLIQRKVKKRWLVSYDDAPKIIDLYSGRKSMLHTLQYNAASAYKGSEVFIFSDNLSVPVASSVASVNEALMASFM